MLAAPAPARVWDQQKSRRLGVRRGLLPNFLFFAYALLAMRNKAEGKSCQSLSGLEHVTLRPWVLED